MGKTLRFVRSRLLRKRKQSARGRIVLCTRVFVGQRSQDGPQPPLSRERPHPSFKGAVRAPRPPHRLAGLADASLPRRAEQTPWGLGKGGAWDRSEQLRACVFPDTRDPRALNRSRLKMVSVGGRGGRGRERGRGALYEKLSSTSFHPGGPRSTPPPGTRVAPDANHLYPQEIETKPLAHVQVRERAG